MRIEIHGHDLPGADVHVGVQRKDVVVDIVCGDVATVVWSFDIDVVDGADGVDFKGPFVQGKKGDRFLYLSWGRVDDDGVMVMFRRAKLMLMAVPVEVLAAARTRTLVGRVGLTMKDGTPLCAAVRPSVITWSCRDGT